MKRPAPTIMLGIQYGHLVTTEGNIHWHLLTRKKKK